MEGEKGAEVHFLETEERGRQCKDEVTRVVGGAFEGVFEFEGYVFVDVKAVGRVRE